MTKTEKSLASIFAHCDAVAAGLKPATPPDVADELARLFLGLKTQKFKRQKPL